MNFLIRLDISKKIGTGHFRRMLNLTQYLSMHNFTFLVSTDNKINDIFKNKDIYFTDTQHEVEDIGNLVEKKKITAFILDLLHYPDEYIMNLKFKFNKKIISFHEYNDLSDYSDLAINYNLINYDKYISSEKTLLGPQYIIFDNQLLKTAKKECKEEYIFVSFGGSDPSSLIESFIVNIANKMTEYNFYIHLGNFKKINQDKINITSNMTILEQPQDLFSYMKSAKFAITAAGNMMYELMYFKIPMIVIAHNEHQAEFANNASKLKCIKYLGLAKNLDFNLLENNIKKLYGLSCQYSTKIDGDGLLKIKQAIEKVCE